MGRKGEIMRELPTRYKWVFRQEFYSIHSGGPCKESINGVCPHGMWSNVTLLKISNWFHDNHYGIWYKWANRKYFNRSRRFLLKVFPNLRM